MKPYRCRKHGLTEPYDYGNKLRQRRTCKICRAENVKRTWLEVKMAVIQAYGGACACCGESEPGFLTIDHVKGDGKEHRATVGRGYKLYTWLRNNEFPKDDYQLLCYNCNCSRGQYGVCPHRKEPS